jgi:hypothetical protein
MARTLNEQLLHEAGLAEPEADTRHKRAVGDVLRGILTVIVLVRLGLLLVALVLAITFSVLPWPGDLRTALFDVAMVAAIGLLGRAWYLHRQATKTPSKTRENQGDRWTSTS